MDHHSFLCMYSGFEPNFRLENFVQKAMAELAHSILPKRSFDFCFSLEKTQFGYHCKLSAHTPIQFISVETHSDSPRESVLKSLAKLKDRLGVPEAAPKWFESWIWMKQPLLHPH